MKRSGPIKADPAKTRAWQARGAKKYADRRRDNAGNVIRRNATPQPVDNPVDNRCSECGGPMQDSEECRTSGMCLTCLNGPVPGARKSREKESRRSAPRNRSKNATRRPRRDDSDWRNAVMARCGERCRGCGTVQHVQADHVWPRGQGGPSHVLNGLPLCGEFGKDCHGRKTRSEIVIEWHWLDDEQRAWLAEQGWVAWDDDGEPFGRGRRHFGSRRVRDRHTERVEHGEEG